MHVRVICAYVFYYRRDCNARRARARNPTGKHTHRISFIVINRAPPTTTSDGFRRDAAIINVVGRYFTSRDCVPAREYTSDVSVYFLTSNKTLLCCGTNRKIRVSRSFFGRGICLVQKTFEAIRFTGWTMRLNYEKKLAVYCSVHCAQTYTRDLAAVKQYRIVFTTKPINAVVLIDDIQQRAIKRAIRIDINLADELR